MLLVVLLVMVACAKVPKHVAESSQDVPSLEEPEPLPVLNVSLLDEDVSLDEELSDADLDELLQ